MVPMLPQQASSNSWVRSAGSGGDVVKPGTEYDAAGRVRHFVDGSNVETTLGYNALPWR